MNIGAFPDLHAGGQDLAIDFDHAVFATLDENLAGTVIHDKFALPARGKIDSRNSGEIERSAAFSSGGSVLALLLQRELLFYFTNNKLRVLLAHISDLGLQSRLLLGIAFGDDVWNKAFATHCYRVGWGLRFFFQVFLGCTSK